MWQYFAWERILARICVDLPSTPVAFWHVTANAVNFGGEASVQPVGGMWVKVSEQNVQAQAGLALLINESSLHDTGHDQVRHDAHHLFPSEHTLITTCSMEGQSNSTSKWNHPVYWQQTGEWGRHLDYLPRSLHQRVVDRRILHALVCTYNMWKVVIEK